MLESAPGMLIESATCSVTFELVEQLSCTQSRVLAIFLGHLLGDTLVELAVV